MLLYDLNEKKDKSIYEYLYNCIRDDIYAGRLKPGEKLPSKRKMAQDNGIAVITVENAYAQLIVEGYIDARPRSGYFVLDIMQMREASGRAEGQYADIPRGVDPANISGGVYTEPVSGKRRYDAPGTLDPGSRDAGTPRLPGDFTSAGLEYDSFPYSTWTRIMRNVLSDLQGEFTKAPPSAGITELRQAIADHLSASKNLDVSWENIIIGPGTEYLHSVIIQLLGHNRLVAVEDPGYKAVGLIYENNGMKVVHIPVDSDGMQIDKLADSGATLIHVSPAHHFPTGAVMSAPTRHKLLNWAHLSGSYVIEDDYDSEFRFKGRPLPALFGLDSDRVIYMNTFTETLAPSIRMAYMVLPDRLKEIYYSRLSFLSGTVSTFDQLTMARFISLGYYERHIGRMRNRYRILRDGYREAFEASKLKKLAHIVEDPAGLRMTIAFDGKKRMDDAAYIDSLLQKGIRITLMSSYNHRKTDRYDHMFMLRYMNMEKETLTGYFDMMADACRV